MSVSRFAALAGIAERTYWRRLARHLADNPIKGPWPNPKVDEVAEAARLTQLDDLRADRGLMAPIDTADTVIGSAPAPIAVLRHVRTRVRSPQTNGVVTTLGTLKYEHLYLAPYNQ